MITGVLEIAEIDLDKALVAVKTAKIGERTSVCLLAQAVIRQVGPVEYSGWVSVKLQDGRRLSVGEAEDAVRDFDYVTQNADAIMLQELRDSLPLRLDYSIDD